MKRLLDRVGEATRDRSEMVIISLDSLLSFSAHISLLIMSFFLRFAASFFGTWKVFSLPFFPFSCALLHCANIAYLRSIALCFSLLFLVPLLLLFCLATVNLILCPSSCQLLSFLLTLMVCCVVCVCRYQVGFITNCCRLQTNVLRLQSRKPCSLNEK